MPKEVWLHCDHCGSLMCNPNLIFDVKVKGKDERWCARCWDKLKKK